MTDNAAISTDFNDVMFDDNAIDILPLITKERTQKFELLLHLIPNLKQHIILSGPEGIGKTLLLDRLYDIDSDAWLCCFVQGSEELSFEMIEAQLAKSMLRNKHESLAQAFHYAQEKHKKIVLIIDDAGLLVSGLITMLVDYATTHTELKLILSFTPDTRQKYRKTDRVLDNFYLIDMPRLTKEQCAYFLRHLSTKPRTYGHIERIDDKLLSKIYQETQGIPARLITDFTKLSRDTQHDHTRWGIIFAGLLVLALGINQGIRYLKQAPEKTTEADVKTIDEAKDNTNDDEQTNTNVTPPASENATPPVPPVPTADTTETQNTGELSAEKTPDASAPANTTEPASKTDDAPTNATTQTTQNEPVEKKPDVTEKASVANEAQTTVPTSPAVPTVTPPKVTSAPTIAFPKVEPAKGTKIQALPDKIPVTSIALTAPHMEASPSEQNAIDTSKMESKVVEKLADVKVVDDKKENKKEDKKGEDKKSQSAKPEVIKKIPPPKPVVDTLAPSSEAVAPSAPVTPAAPVSPSTPVLGHYTLQLITLSSDAAIAEFLKKHPSLIASHHVMKYEKNGQTRFSLMYGNFANAQEALAARGNLPAEFALALPRKFNAAP